MKYSTMDRPQSNNIWKKIFQTVRKYPWKKHKYQLQHQPHSGSVNEGNTLSLYPLAWLCWLTKRFPSSPSFSFSSFSHPLLLPPPPTLQTCRKSISWNVTICFMPKFRHPPKNFSFVTYNLYNAQAKALHINDVNHVATHIIPVHAYLGMA